MAGLPDIWNAPPYHETECERAERIGHDELYEALHCNTGGRPTEADRGMPLNLPGLFRGVGQLIGGASDIARDIARFGQPSTQIVPIPNPGMSGADVSPLPPPSGGGGQRTAPATPNLMIGRPDIQFAVTRPRVRDVISDALPETRPFLDFGNVDSPNIGTGAQRRAFLLRIVAQETFGRRSLSYSAFKRVVRDLGPEAAKDYMNLTDESMWTILANPPKRRGPYISTRIVNRACTTLRRAERIAGKCKVPSRRRAPPRRRASAVTQISNK